MKFRFQDMEIWKAAIELSDELLDIAEELSEKKYFRFSDQWLMFYPMRSALCPLLHALCHKHN